MKPLFMVLCLSMVALWAGPALAGNFIDVSLAVGIAGQDPSDILKVQNMRSTELPIPTSVSADARTGVILDAAEKTVSLAPPPIVAVEETTWGAIKGLFR